jgi:hypothetical protein
LAGKLIQLEGRIRGLEEENLWYKAQDVINKRDNVENKAIVSDFDENSWLFYGPPFRTGSINHFRPIYARFV